MFENNDHTVSLYKDIRLSEIVRKFELPLCYSPQKEQRVTTQPLLEIEQYQEQIGYLRGEIIRLSSLEIQFSALKRQYAIIENKYESVLNQNIYLHSTNKGGLGLQNQLSEANDKISSLMKINEFLEKQKICLQKQLSSLKNTLQGQEMRGFKLEGQFQIATTQKMQLQQMVDEQRRQKHLLLNKYQKQIKDLKIRMEENEIKFRGQRHTIQSLESMKLNLEMDVKELRQTIRGLQEGLRGRNDQIVTLQVKLKQLENKQGQLEKLRKQLEARDKFLKDIKDKFEHQTKEITTRYQSKIKHLTSQNESIKTAFNNQIASYENLKTNHNDSISTLQTLQSHLFSLKDSATKLQFENTKLESALYTSRVQIEQSRRKHTQLSRTSQDIEHYKQQSNRLKEQVQLIKKRNKEMEYNYRSLLDQVKEAEEQIKPRQSHESRKSTRTCSSKSKQPHHAEITLSTARTKSSHKTRTELSQIIHFDQYKSVIESKLLKPSMSRNESMNDNVMRRCKMYLNR